MRRAWACRSTTARTFWTLGFQRRFVRRCEWLETHAELRLLATHLADGRHDARPTSGLGATTGETRDRSKRPREIPCRRRPPGREGGASTPLRSARHACRPSPRSTAPPWCGRLDVPRRPPRPPGRAEPPQRVPRARRRHRHEHGAHARVGVRRGRRRHPHGRRVPGAGPRVAHGRTGQLRRDPVADPPRPRRHVRPARRRSARRPGDAGLRHASDAAYQAVMRPVEGTILTVVRESAETAEVAAAERLPARSTGSCSSARSRPRTTRSRRTPDMLPVLKDAGVVDAGGTGFSLLLDAFLHVVDGPPAPRARDRHDARRRRRAPARRRRVVAALRGDVPPRGRRPHDPGVQGHVGRDRRLDRRRRRRRAVELPRAHERHRRRGRSRHRGRPPVEDPRHRPDRAGRGASSGCGRRGAERPRRSSGSRGDPD